MHQHICQHCALKLSHPSIPILIPRFYYSVLTSRHLVQWETQWKLIQKVSLTVFVFPPNSSFDEETPQTVKKRKYVLCFYTIQGPSPWMSPYMMTWWIFLSCRWGEYVIKHNLTSTKRECFVERCVHMIWNVRTLFVSIVLKEKYSYSTSVSVYS